MSRGAEGTRRSGGGGRDSDGGASLIGGKGTAQEADSCGRLPPAGINPPIPSIALAPAARVFYLAGGWRFPMMIQDGARLIPVWPLFSSLMCSLALYTIATTTLILVAKHLVLSRFLH